LNTTALEHWDRGFETRSWHYVCPHSLVFCFTV